MTKQIIIEAGKPPAFIGDWTIGEAMQMLRAALEWLGGLPLVTKDDNQKDEEKEA